jgi:carotenoid cleavage dioxygenase-like enzyme
MSTPNTAGSTTAAGFADQRTEIAVDELEISGEIPRWLTGSLLRTGPARWDLDGGSVAHWFDGMAMLHRFAIADGKVGYRNRKVLGNAGRAVEETGRLHYREFATDPCRTAFQRVTSLFDPGVTDNGAVNVDRVGDRWLALTEAPMAVEFDPRTLETLGVRARGPKTAIPVAHPHHDGEARLTLRTKLGPRSRYEVIERAPDGAERAVAAIPARRPSYQHSFALSGTHTVVVAGGLTVDPLRLALSGRPFIDNFDWHPDAPTTLWACDRASGRTVGRWAAPPSFCFHHVNAFEEDDGTIVVDLLAYEDASIIDALRLDRLRAGGTIPSPEMLRYRLRGSGGEAEVERLVDERFELPRIHPRHNAGPYRYVWGVGSDEEQLFGHVLKVDVAARTALRWHDPGAHPGEPVFVPRPGGEAEDDGVLLSVVLEPGRDASSLLVLDAADLREIGRARVPQRIPFGFHGGFTTRV